MTTLNAAAAAVATSQSAGRYEQASEKEIKED